MSRFIDTLEVTPLMDGLQWRLNARLRYESTLAGLIDVPAKFCTDFASIPRIVWAILPPWGRYGSAAIAHDWKYWLQDTDRNTADGVLLEAMTLLGVEKPVCDQVYTAVRMFGGSAWEHNAQLKAAGYKRMSNTPDVPPYAGIPA